MEFVLLEVFEKGVQVSVTESGWPSLSAVFGLTVFCFFDAGGGVT